MDLTDTGLARARQSGRTLVRADATRIAFATHTFDVVSAFDMLQCVTDDHAAVHEIARVLKPGGWFVGTAAALQILHGDHSVLSEEVRRYTSGGMRRLLETAGLKPLYVRYAFASVFPLMLGVRLMQRARGARADGQEITVPPSPINAALTGLVSLEAAVSRVVPMPVGSSVVFLAQK
jgi:ubiquinone/menaquinone biosynthesis C-methylase UbiE